MEAQELFKLAHKIYMAFDPSDTGENHTENIVLEVFHEEIESAQKVLLEGNVQKAQFAYDDLLYTRIPWAYFGLGYALGQMVDLTDSEIQESIKSIQKEIRKKGLLPYLPRERTPQ